MSVRRCLEMLLVALACGWIGHVWAHELPPGVVERAVQGTLYPDRLEITYQFGMSEQTIRDELTRASVSPSSDLLDLERQYLEHLTEKIGPGLFVTLDGTRQTASQVDPELIYQHHLQFEIRLTYRGPFESPAGRLVIDDRNFPELPGHFRVAFKGRGGAKVRSTNAVPVIVRAERVATSTFNDTTPRRPHIEASLGDDPDSVESAGAVGPEPAMGQDAPRVERPPESTPPRVTEPLANATKNVSIPWKWLALLGLIVAVCSLPFLVARKRNG